MAMLLTSHADLDPAESTQLARLIDDAAQAFSGDAAGNRIIVDVEPDMALVSADQRRMARVLRSVLTDAFLSCDGSMPVRVTAARDSSIARVSVTHCGAAPAARLAGLFDKRSRDRPDEDSVSMRRSELDLAISKGIVEAHGGRIWADSDEAAGETRVSFTLPFAQPPQSAPAADTPRQTARPAAAARILVVDYGLDEAVLRAVESGAADYIVKPFSPTELLARVRAALHRPAAPALDAPAPFVLGDLTVDFASRTVWVNGRRADLTETEIRLLCELAANPGRVLSYSQLMRRVWTSDSPNPAGPVRSAVKRLRRKLEDDARNPAYIFTVPRAGYRIGTPQQAAPAG